MKDHSTRPIIAFDLDGTLLSHNGEIHPRDVELLTMPKPPAIFVPATGRSLTALRKIFLEYQIVGDKPLPFPLVLQNGSVIYGEGETLLRKIHFDLDMQSGLINVFLTHPDVSILLFSGDKIRMLNPTRYGLERTGKYLYKPEPFDLSAPAQACTKIICISQDPAELSVIHKQVNTFGIEAACSLPTTLELNPPGVNKGTGLEYLAMINKWEKDRVFCVGDGDNDAGMLRRFPVTFAPSTCPQVIQQMATHVINPAEEGLFTAIFHKIQ